MAGLTDYFDSIARVVGGTAPDPTNRPRWFSGVDSADGTGVSGLNGCYSGPQANFTASAPFGVVDQVRQRLSNPIADTLTQGNEFRSADFRVWVLYDPVDWETNFTLMSAIPDSMYAAFASHVGLFGLSNAYQAAVVADDGPKTITFPWLPSRQFMGWEFTVRVLRDFYGRTYTA